MSHQNTRNFLICMRLDLWDQLTFKQSLPSRLIATTKDIKRLITGVYCINIWAVVGMERTITSNMFLGKLCRHDVSVSTFKLNSVQFQTAHKKKKIVACCTYCCNKTRLVFFYDGKKIRAMDRLDDNKSLTLLVTSSESTSTTYLAR